MIDLTVERTPCPLADYKRHVDRSPTYGLVSLTPTTILHLSELNRAGLSIISASSEPAETFFELEALFGRASQQMRKNQ